MNYELIIIGGGPAGLTAGIYAQREGIKTLLLEKIALGGQIVLSENVENYPGFPEAISGLELVQRMEKQARKFGLEIVNEEVKSLEVKSEKSRIVKTESKEYESQAVIVATGTQPKKLGVPGEERLVGKGVSYCATCDGPFFKNREVAVVGGGDTAVQEAIFLAGLAKKVFLIHRRAQLRAAGILQERAKANPKIEFVWDSIVAEIIGEAKVEGLRIKNLKTGKLQTIGIDGVFMLVGVEPQTKFLKGLLQTDGNGYIITDENMQTSVPGIFACGDCRKKLLRQVVTACGEAATAAFAAGQYIIDL